MYNTLGHCMVYYTFNPRLLDDVLSVRYAMRDTTLFSTDSTLIRLGRPTVPLPPDYDWSTHPSFPDYKERAALIQGNSV